MQSESNRKKTLVLDLDETLVHSRFYPVSNYDIKLNLSLEGNQASVYVHRRPGANELLTRLA